MIDTEHITIAEARKLLDAKEISSVELTRAMLGMIEKNNPNINAFVEVFDDAEVAAANADHVIADGNARPLTGIPIALKDNILMNGKQASSGSKILEGYRAIYDAGVTEKLLEQHAVVVGRTNMDEFAMGSSTESSAWGITKNPHDTRRVPGGSSGGSAAAVAMNGVLCALGSDTGGSIRQPGAFCGVVGLKPTYGAVSRRGLMAMASSLDQIGPFAKTVADAELVYDAIKGRDPKDSTSAPDVFHERGRAEGAKKTLRIGIPTDFLRGDGKGDGMSDAVRENFNNTIKLLEKEGHETREISLPHIGSSLATYYIIMPAEASTNLARFDGVRFGLHKDGVDLLSDYMETRGAGFGAEVRRRIMLGAYVLSSGYYDAFYNKANDARQLITADFDRAFEEVDVIATPTTPTSAWKFGEKSASPLQMYLADIFTVPANIAGIPAMSVPSGYEEVNGARLPLGFQLMAPAWHEHRLFQMGSVVERVAGSGFARA